MDTKELARLLDRIDYGTKIPTDITTRAAQAGLVIAYGASDDLLKFDGAFRDEIGAYAGTEVVVDRIGVIPNFNDLVDNRGHDLKGRLRDYFRREGDGKTIKILWRAEGDYSWTFETKIPHETFEIVEYGGPFCRGIVFSVADLEP